VQRWFVRLRSRLVPVGRGLHRLLSGHLRGNRMPRVARRPIRRGPVLLFAGFPVLPNRQRLLLTPGSRGQPDMGAEPMTPLRGCESGRLPRRNRAAPGADGVL
jgi:hypothetical protein